MERFEEAPGFGEIGIAEGEVKTVLCESARTITALQSLAQRVYGCLEADRALVWALEEFGELASAARRQEGPERLTEELGQLAMWMFCLGNILSVDLSRAMSEAVLEETSRQIAKYGRIKPYGE